MMSVQDQYDDVQASYGRCLRQKDFISRFYEILMASHPDIWPMFQRTDFGQQRKALRRGISISISFAAGSTSAQLSMDNMAQIHSHSGRAPVAPHYYQYWIDSLIKTIAEFDSRFDDVLEQRWRSAMQKTIDYFSHTFPQTKHSKPAA